MEVNAQASGWQEFYADRQSRCDSATDEALKKHFTAELEVARQTMKAMGLEVPESGAPDGQKPEGVGPDGQTPETLGPDGQTPEKLPGQEVPTNGAVKTEGDEALSYDDEEKLAGYRKEVANGGENVQTPTGDSPTQPVPSPDQQSAPLTLNPALEPFRDDIMAAAKATGVPPELIAAMIWEESKGDPEAMSVNGGNGGSDIGLMQVNEKTFAAMKEKHPDLITGTADNPKDNIMAGALYLAEQQEKFGGDWDLALRAYNSGPESVDINNPDVSTTGEGTAEYVNRVNSYRDLITQGADLPDGLEEKPAAA